MREWHKPTIEETESGVEVTSHPPAELDRAYPTFSSRKQTSGD